MDDNIQNPNDEVADFREVFDKPNAVVETSETAPPAQAVRPKNFTIKRPVVVILVASIIVVIGLMAITSFLNNQSGKEQINDIIPPTLPQSPGQK